MNKKTQEFKSIVPDYNFSSSVFIKGNKKTVYMHVMAFGCKLNDLQKVVENHLIVDSKQEIDLKYGNRDIKYSGKKGGVKYEVILEYGACPTPNGGEGHNIEIKSSSRKEDKLSPFLAEEMKKYESEMTARLNQ
jgi:hypothetical protein